MDVSLRTSLNWFFFRIIFPELKAVCSTWNASHCIKRNIFPSTSFISSGYSSMHAFPMSTLHAMLEGKVPYEYGASLDIAFEIAFQKTDNVAFI